MSNDYIPGFRLFLCTLQLIFALLSLGLLFIDTYVMFIMDSLTNLGPLDTACQFFSEGSTVRQSVDNYYLGQLT